MAADEQELAAWHDAASSSLRKTSHSSGQWFSE
jgi:hypothetical protein